MPDLIPAKDGIFDRHPGTQGLETSPKQSKKLIEERSDIIIRCSIRLRRIRCSMFSFFGFRCWMVTISRLL